MANKSQVRVADELSWPQSPEETECVRAQLERMLNDPLFSQSRRYPRLFRRIVEASLAGEIGNLKERVLGIELFERAPDYDTNADAIVRVTAAELRKRIAQYYHEEQHRQEPRIDLPVGGYVATFSSPQAEKKSEPLVVASEAVTEIPELEEKSESIQDRRPGSRRAWLVSAASAIAFVLVLTVGILAWMQRPDEVDRLWQPFLSKGASPVLCVGQLAVNVVPQGPQGSLARSLLGQRPVSISDAVVVSEYATYLGTKKIRPRIQVSTATTYADLRQHPVLLVGGLDNNWTMRILEQLRYRMKSEPNSSILQIYDSTNPSGSNWKMDFAKTPEHVIEDYAIVGRFYSSTTENTVIVAAGLGENGTSVKGGV